MSNIRLKKSYESLIKKLRTKEEYFDENGDLLKSKVVYDAQNDREEILDVLLSDEKLTEIYFKTIRDTKVFLKDKFINTINHKEFFPSSYTSYLNYIGLLDGTDFIKKSKDVVLNFPYKDCILEGGQSREEQSLKEFFYNETLANDEVDRLLHPKVFTNVKKYTKDVEEDNPTFKHTDNLYIKGNNLIILHSLYKRYHNSIKLIYIDPPFNTEKDSFTYNDKFNHSSWLTFIKNRLDISNKLLTEDGYIVVNIGNEEVSYLKVLMDEIFGLNNFINMITMTTNDPSGFKATSSKIFSTSNYLLIYAKDKETSKEINKVHIEKDYDTAYKYFLENKNDNYKEWKWVLISDIIAEKYGFKTKNEAIKNLGELVFKAEVEKFAIENKENVFRTAAISGGAKKKRINTIVHSKSNRDEVFIHPNEDLEGFYILNGEQILFYEDRFNYVDGKYVPSSTLTDIWTDISWTGIAPEGGVTLKNGKKPEKLLKRIIEMFTNEKDIVLDYFSGSGTTASVAYKMNRQFIATEQLYYGENDTLSRLKNVLNGDKSGISKLVNWKGGGSFTYMELMKNNQSYIDTITECTTSEQLIEIKSELRNSNFIRYEVKDENLFDENNQFDTLSVDEQKEILIKILDKNHLYINYSEIDDSQYNISDEDKKFNREFYEVK